MAESGDINKQESNSKDLDKSTVNPTIGTPAKGVLGPDWFVAEFKNYQKTGDININPDSGFYLDTADSYYSDPDVREVVTGEVEVDAVDPLLFQAYYKALRTKYIEKTEDIHLEARGISSAPMQLYNTDKQSSENYLPTANWDQMMYDDGRLSIGGRSNASTYSHKEGKTDRIMAPDGSIKYASDYKSHSAAKEDPTLINDKGEKPVGFRYTSNEMSSDNRGGAIVPFYSSDNYYDKANVVSAWEFNDYTTIYRESHGWHALVKTPINFLISAIDNSLVETAKNTGYIIFGKESKHIDTLTYLNDMSNVMTSWKVSPSDEAAAMDNAEAWIGLLMDVGLQIGTMGAIGKGVNKGIKGLSSIKKLGIPKSGTEMYGAYAGRAWMTTFAANEVGAQGRALGLTEKEAALTAFAAVGALWGVNTWFNWVEHSIISKNLIKKGLQKEIANEIAKVASTNKSAVNLTKAGGNIKDRMVNFFNTTQEYLSPKLGGNIAQQTLSGSASETAQESVEFFAEEIIKNLSNLTRYYRGDYSGTDDDAFKGYQWISDEKYFSDYFFHGLMISAAGGFLGGAVGKAMLGYSSKVDDMMTYSILTGNEDAFYAARDKFKKDKAWGNPALSMDKDSDGEFHTMQEAKVVNSNPIDQNTIHMNAVENVFHFKLKTLEALGLRGAGVDNYAKVLDKTPELKKFINSYEVGNQLKTAYNIIQEATSKGISIDTIAKVTDSVAEINKEYYKSVKIRQGEEAVGEVEESPEEVREAEIKNATTALTDSSDELSLDEATKVVEAVQKVQDILSGKYAESMFINAMYQFDRAQPEKKRNYKMLDGNAEVGSIENILAELNVISQAREVNKSRHNSNLATQVKNDEIVKGKGTFAEKVNSLNIRNGTIYLSPEDRVKLESQFDMKSLKKTLNEKADKITVEDFAEISPQFQEALKTTDTSALAIIVGLELNKDGTIDKEATVKSHIKELKSQINKIDSFEDIANLEITVPAIDDKPISKPLRSLKAFQQKIIGEAYIENQHKNPEEYAALEILSSNEAEVLDKWNDTDLNHLFADYNLKDNKLDYVKDSNFITEIAALEQDWKNSKKGLESLGKNTFKDFERVKQLIDKIERRKALFAFTEAIEFPLAQFRRSLGNNKLISFDLYEKYDSELTQFNRTFNRMLYSPARRVELEIKHKDGTLSDKELIEFQKLVVIHNGYTKGVKKTIDKRLKVLEKIYADKSNTIGVDIAKKNKFKEKVVALRQELQDDISFLIEYVDKKQGADYKKAIDETTAFSELFKYPDVTIRSKEGDIEEILELIVRAKDEIYRSYNKKMKSVVDVYAELNDSDELKYTKTIRNVLYAAGYPMSNYVAGYKGYINLDEKEGVKPLFNFPINYSQFISTFEAVSFLFNTDTQKYIRLAKQKSGQSGIDDMTKEDIEVLSPDGVMAIIGKLGTGKTEVVGTLALKLALDELGLSDQSIIIAAAVDKQVTKLAASLDRAGLKVDDRTFRIGNKAKMGKHTNIVNFLDQNKNKTLEGVSTIFIDEATYIDDTDYNNKAYTVSKLESKAPQATTFFAAIKSINANREAASMPKLRVLLMGDKYQNGSITLDSSGRPELTSVFENTFLPATQYLTESERSQVGVLNQSIDSILRLTRNTRAALFDKKLSLKYGYDETAEMVLGVMEVKSFESLTKDEVKGSTSTLSEILLKNMQEDPDFEIIVASNKYSKKTDLISSMPFLKPLLDSQSYSGRVRVMSHDDVQGDEVSFSIVHLDDDSFRGSLTDNKVVMGIHMRTLATSVGRARVGSVIINESGYKIESEYVKGETIPPPNVVEKVVESLRKFQRNAFSKVKTKVPTASTEPEVEPSTEPVAEPTIQSEPTPKPGPAQDWKFTKEEIITEFEEDKGFIVPDNYDPSNLTHRKYILQKALYHITGKSYPSTQSESQLIKSYTAALDNIGVDNTISMVNIVDSLKSDELQLIVKYQQIIYNAYQNIKDLPDNNFTEAGSDVYFGEYFKVSGISTGIGFKGEFQLDDKPPVIIPMVSLLQFISKDKGDTLYSLSGEVGPLSESNRFAYDMRTGNTMIYMPDSDENSTEHMPLLTKTTRSPFILMFSLKGVSDENLFESHRHLRSQLAKILSKDPLWKQSYKQKANQVEILEKLRKSKDAEIRLAADAYLIYIYDMSSKKSLDAKAFAQRLLNSDKAAQDEVTGTDLMKALDVKGIVSVYTEEFNTFLPDVNPGVESLVHTAEEMLPDMDVADASNPDEYQRVSRGLLNKDNIQIQPSKFITYAYKSTVPNNEYTTMMVAGIYNGKVYVLGHFNNTTNPGPNLKKIQQKAIDAYKGPGKGLIGIWNPGAFYSLFHTSKSLTPGKVITGAKSSVNDIKAMLLEKGLYPGPIRIITTDGLEHSGKAVMFYSSDPTDSMQDDLTLTSEEDKELGMLEGPRGVILLDPGYMSMEEIAKVMSPDVRDLSSINYELHPIVRSFTMNHISENLTSSFAALTLAYLEEYPIDGFTAAMQQELTKLRDEVNSPVWTPKDLKTLVKDIGPYDPEVELNAMQALVLGIIHKITYPPTWGGYATDSNGALKRSKFNNPMIKHTNSAITYAPGGGDGFVSSYIEFNFYDFIRTMISYTAELGSIKEGSNTLTTPEDMSAALFRALDIMMSKYSNKEFKHGFRLIPVLAQKTAVGSAFYGEALGLGEIDTISLDGLEANVKGFNSPLLHVNATSDGLNIWDSVNQTTEVTDYMPAQPADVDIMVRDISVKVKDLRNPDTFKKTVEEAGLIDTLYGITELDKKAEAIDRIAAELDEILGDYNLKDEINNYISELADDLYDDKYAHLDTKQEEDGITLENIMQDPVVGSLTVEQYEQVEALVNVLSLLDSLSDSVTTNRDIDEAIGQLTSLSSTIELATFNPTILNSLRDFTKEITSKYENADLEANLSGYEAKINALLDNEGVVLSLTTAIPTVDSSLVEKILAYYSVDPTVDGAEDIRQTIKEMIVNRDVSKYDTIQEMAMLESDELDDLFRALQGKGNRKYNRIVKDYNAARDNFKSALLQELKTGKPSGNTSISEAVKTVSALSLAKSALDIEKILSASSSLNLFTITGDTFTDPTVSNLNLDTLLFKQHAELLKMLISDPAFSKFTGSIDTQVAETIIEGRLKTLLTDINTEYLASKSMMQPVDILSSYLPDMTLKSNILETTVLSMLASKGIISPTPEQLARASNSLENMIVETSKYTNGIPSALPQKAGALLSIMSSHVIPTLGLDETQVNTLRNTLTETLINKPKEYIKIIC